MNKVLLLGHIGADPDIKTIKDGLVVLNFRMATTEVYYDKQHEKHERTEWHRVAMFGKRAEAVAKFLTTGRQVLVEGRIETTSYEKNGEKRYGTKVIANDVILAGKRPDGHTPAIEQIPLSNGIPTAAAEVDIPF